jgi:hypothetical protein
MWESGSDKSNHNDDGEGWADFEDSATAQQQIV